MIKEFFIEYGFQLTDIETYTNLALTTKSLCDESKYLWVTDINLEKRSLDVWPLLVDQAVNGIMRRMRACYCAFLWVVAYFTSDWCSLIWLSSLVIGLS